MSPIDVPEVNLDILPALPRCAYKPCDVIRTEHVRQGSILRLLAKREILKNVRLRLNRNEHLVRKIQPQANDNEGENNARLSDNWPFNHPILVLSRTTEQPDIITFCAMTSFGTKPVEERLAAEPMRWRNYLPISPRDSHPIADYPTLHHKEGATVKKPGYVRIDEVYTMQLADAARFYDHDKADLRIWELDQDSVQHVIAYVASCTSYKPPANQHWPTQQEHQLGLRIGLSHQIWIEQRKRTAIVLKVHKSQRKARTKKPERPPMTSDQRPKSRKSPQPMSRPLSDKRPTRTSRAETSITVAPSDDVLAFFRSQRSQSLGVLQAPYSFDMIPDTPMNTLSQDTLDIMNATIVIFCSSSTRDTSIPMHPRTDPGTAHIIDQFFAKALDLSQPVAVATDYLKVDLICMYPGEKGSQVSGQGVLILQHNSAKAVLMTRRSSAQPYLAIVVPLVDRSQVATSKRWRAIRIETNGILLYFRSTGLDVDDICAVLIESLNRMLGQVPYNLQLNETETSRFIAQGSFHAAQKRRRAVCKRQGILRTVSDRSIQRFFTGMIKPYGSRTRFGQFIETSSREELDPRLIAIFDSTVVARVEKITGVAQQRFVDNIAYAILKDIQPPCSTVSPTPILDGTFRLTNSLYNFYGRGKLLVTADWTIVLMTKQLSADGSWAAIIIPTSGGTASAKQEANTIMVSVKEVFLEFEVGGKASIRLA